MSPRLSATPCLFRSSVLAERVKEFLKGAKGVVPKLSTFNDHTIDIFASIRSSDEDGEDADADEVLEELDEMDLDTSSSSRTLRRQRESALKYMEQLQRIADRKQKGIVVELQDLAEVSRHCRERINAVSWTFLPPFFSDTIHCLDPSSVLESAKSRYRKHTGGFRYQQCSALCRVDL
jgi:hypothetical protein